MNNFKSDLDLPQSLYVGSISSNFYSCISSTFQQREKEFFKIAINSSPTRRAKILRKTLLISAIDRYYYYPPHHNCNDTYYNVCCYDFSNEIAATLLPCLRTNFVPSGNVAPVRVKSPPPPASESTSTRFIRFKCS